MQCGVKKLSRCLLKEAVEHASVSAVDSQFHALMQQQSTVFCVVFLYHHAQLLDDHKSDWEGMS